MKIRQTVLKNRTPNTRYGIIKPITKRFSPRIFSHAKISKQQLNQIFEAVRWTPSARNRQPWKFFVVGKQSKAYKILFDTCIPERNHWAKSASVIVVACYDQSEPIDETNQWAQYDLGAAVYSLVLQAQELGLYSRQIGSYDKERTKNELNIPNPWQPFVLVAMGGLGSEADYEKAEKEYVEKDLIISERKTDIFEKLK